MLNAYEILGIPADSDEQQVRAAYHANVKKFHPDLYTDPTEQDCAQRKLVQLNLAYEQAMESAARRGPVFRTVPADQAKALAKKMMDQKQYESALCQLGRAESRDGEWFFLQGEVMLELRQYVTAHQSFREAVRRDPDNLSFRRRALDAALAVKRRKAIPYRLADSLHDIFRGGGKRR